MEIRGRIIHATETRSGVSARTGNPWASKDYVMEIPNGQYNPHHFVFSVFGEERIKQFALRKDEEVTIQFDVDASEYNGRWYNRITAYAVSRPVADQSQPQNTEVQSQNDVSVPQQAQSEEDLPF